MGRACNQYHPVPCTLFPLLLSRHTGFLPGESNLPCLPLILPAVIRMTCARCLYVCSTMRLALMIQNMGGARCLEEVRQSGFLALPSASTLKRYRNYTKEGSGWHDLAVLECATLVTDDSACPLGGLAFDEMKIKCGLVFNLSTNNTFLGVSDVDERTEGDYLSDLLAGRSVGVEELSKMVYSSATHVLEFTWSSLGTKTCRCACMWGGQGQAVCVPFFRTCTEAPVILHNCLQVSGCLCAHQRRVC